MNDMSMTATASARARTFNPARIVRQARRMLRDASDSRERIRKRALLAETIRHYAGADPRALPATDPLVICLVRDGAPFAQKFIDYHRALGVRHFLFLDNGSTDGTLEMLASHADVTILTTDFPFAGNDALMRSFLVEEFAYGRWSLVLDIDEFFDYPHSADVPLGALIAYLDRNGFDSLQCNMLDMFPAVLERKTDDRLQFGRHCYYEVDDLVRRTCPPVKRCRFNGRPGELLYGGMRSRVFGLTNVMLTKFSLHKIGPSARRDRNNHFVLNSNVADISGVLFHYKFVGTFHETVADAVRRENHWKGSFEYKKYYDRIARAERLDLLSERSRLYDGLESLIRTGFLHASDRYRDHARRTVAA